MRRLLIGSLFLAKSAFGDVTVSPKDAAPLYYDEFAAVAGKSDQVLLWEGLPSDLKKLSSGQQKAAKISFKIGDQAFYAQAIPLTDAEASEVTDAVLKHRENFRSWSGVKFCGGFHADYAVEWRSKGVTQAQALFCFSCGEARLLVGQRVELVDQSVVGNPRFLALFLPHRRQRPAFQVENAPYPTIPKYTPKMEVPAPVVVPPDPGLR